MNRIGIYIFLILIFLGVSKGVIHTEIGNIYIKNKQVLPFYFKGSPISVILIRYYKTGLFIHTYYHVYKIVYDFKMPEVLLVRTSKKFYEKNKNNLGLTIFRRFLSGEEESFALPPGVIFLNSPIYGYWKKTNKLKEKLWKFRRGHRQLEKILGLENFLYSYKDYKKIMAARRLQKDYHLSDELFGLNGRITRKWIKVDDIENKVSDDYFVDNLKKYFRIIIQ